MKEDYNIIYTGNLQTNVVLSQAVNQISVLFKIPEDKARSFITTEKEIIIKKNVSSEVAKKYRLALTEIGLEIKIISNKQRDKKPQQSRNIKSKNNLNKDPTNIRAPDTSLIKKQPKGDNKSKKYFSLAIFALTVLVGSLSYYLYSLENELKIGPFQADYYVEDDGNETGKGTDGSDQTITLTHKYTETVKRPSISFGHTDLFGIKPYNFFGIWEGDIVLPDNESVVNVNFDLSWSDISFFIDGELKDKWKNDGKVITLKSLKGKHKVRIELHNHWHTAGFNVSFTEHKKLNKASVVEVLKHIDFETTKSIYAGVYEASSRTPGNFYNELLIFLPDTSSPVFLFLNSYNAVNWVINNHKETKISGVILSSYAPGSTISNNENCPVYDLTYSRGNYKSAHSAKSLIDREIDFVFNKYSVSEIIY